MREVAKFDRLRIVGLWASLAVAGLGSSARSASAALDVWRLVPSDTRVVLIVDALQADRQPEARDALGNEAVLGRLVSRRLAATDRGRQIVAYIQEGAVTHPVVITSGAPGLDAKFKKLCGKQIETISGHSIWAATPEGWVAAALDPGCTIEGPRQTVRAVLENVSRQGSSLASLGQSKPARRLLAVTPAATTAVTLLYFAPEGGKTVYEVLQDLDRTLGADMSASLASYQSALKMLGTTQAARLDLAQDGDDVNSTLRLAMPSSMAANITSVSLLAGKEMARGASDAALKAGTLSAQDATVLAGALDTLESQAEGEIVLVHVRVPESQPPEQGAR